MSFFVLSLILLFTSRSDWVEHFHNRNLRAYSAYPLLAYPTHYVGDKEWFSDTGKRQIILIVKDG